MPVIHIIRHSQASFGGDSYDVVSELGHRQSALLDEALAARGVRADRVAAGALQRQQQTARACVRSAPAELVVDPRWDEYATADVLAVHGDLPQQEGEGTELGAPAGLTSQEFQALLDIALMRWIAAGESSPTAESWPAFQARALGALEELAGSLDGGGHGIAFTSGGVVAAIATALIGAPGETFVALNRVSVNSGASKVLSGRNGLRLVTFNDHAHLEHDRSLMTFR